MKKNSILKKAISLFSLGVLVFSASVTLAQTNVYDDIIATSPNHTSLKAALVQEGLDTVLQDPNGSFTVFAPTNDAFDDLATALGTNVAGLLALPVLDEILIYHVLAANVPSSLLENGDIVPTASIGNTIKFTVTASGDVFANQAFVEIPDLTADNGVVHSIDAVLLPFETVVDVAIDNGFTTLTTAVATAELLPALTDPLAAFTVFAPTNEAFDDLAADLSTDIAGLLALENLGDILLYHVVSGTVLSNELIAGPIATLNGATVNVDLTNGVMINLATVSAADVTADNGVVHVIDMVLVPSPLGTEDVNKETLNVYPNPAVNELFITNSSNTNFQIIDIKGSIILNGEAKKSIDVSSLTKGVYVLNLISDQEVSTHRIVKQ